MEQTFSPTVQALGTPQHTQQLAITGAHGSGSEMVSVALMREEREHMERERDRLEAKLEEQRQEIERLRQQAFESQLREQAAQAKIEKLAPQEAASAEQVEALTARLAALHAAELLSDDELFGLEDCVADFVEAKCAVDVTIVTTETVNALRAVGKVQKLVALSAGMPRDAMFARQLRRKFA